MSKLNDLKGQRFGRLIVLQRGADRGKQKKTAWICQCDCGNVCEPLATELRRGTTQSCGCMAREKIVATSTTHGHNPRGQRSPELTSYTMAKNRCTNPNADNYKFYGGRGIEFRFDSFEQFYALLGERPDGTTLDRIENDGHYEPGNVRWATPKDQANNRRMAA